MRNVALRHAWRGVLWPVLGAAALVPVMMAGVAKGQDVATAAGQASDAMKSLLSGVDTIWVLVGAFLVFFMQAGFGMVEAGFIRAKNSCNILTKNFMDYCAASIMFSPIT